MANNYETTFTVNGFAGLAQDGNGFNTDLKYAFRGKNFDTTGGVLRSMGGYTALTGTLPAPIGTLAALYRRYPPEDATDALVFVAAAGAKLYAREESATTWTEIHAGLTSDSFDFVTYEVNEDSEGEPTDAPIDVLLLTNAKDGMLCVYGNDLTVKAVSIAPGGTALKFNVMARHAERIWVTGNPDDPDKLMYSAPYNPFDWTANAEIPEDGAGDVLQPSWDGDSFVALRPFGSQLLAFKKSRVWRILGTDPSTYIMKEQYGGGSIVENTVTVSNDRVYMLGYGGLMVYDGVEVTRFYPQRIQHVISRINYDHINKACACMRGETFCLALPLDTSTVNNAILEYNERERTFCLREGVSAKSFLTFADKVYFTSDETPGKMWEATGGTMLPMEWESAYQDMGAKNVQKSSFVVYLSANSAITITVSIKTERKDKTKTVTLTKDKVKAIRISNAGRFWRLKLSTTSTTAWELQGGLTVNMELDHD